MLYIILLLSLNFGNNLFSLLSSNCCHKMMLLESLTIPLTQYWCSYHSVCYDGILQLLDTQTPLSQRHQNTLNPFLSAPFSPPRLKQFYQNWLLLHYCGQQTYLQLTKKGYVCSLWDGTARNQWLFMPSHVIQREIFKPPHCYKIWSYIV